MKTLVYTIRVSIPGQETHLVENLECKTNELNPQDQVINTILELVEATLSKMNTGARGVFRLGNKVFVINDDKVPVIEVITHSLFEA